jgi:hypothetical protein
MFKTAVCDLGNSRGIAMQPVAPDQQHHHRDYETDRKQDDACGQNQFPCGTGLR